MSVEDYLKSGEYLPSFLRGFHNQKDFFKTMHETMDVPKSLPEGMHINWIAGHCYIVSVFLNFMAKRGYTLQRSRKRLDFRDIGADLEAAQIARDEASFGMLRAYMDRDKKEETTDDSETQSSGTPGS